MGGVSDLSREWAANEYFTPIGSYVNETNFQLYLQRFTGPPEYVSLNHRMREATSDLWKLAFPARQPFSWLLRKSLILSWRRDRDSEHYGSFRLCKLQIPHRLGCHLPSIPCALPEIARHIWVRAAFRRAHGSDFLPPLRLFGLLAAVPAAFACFSYSVWNVGLGISVSTENKEPSRSRRSAQIERNQQLPKFSIKTVP